MATADNRRILAQALQLTAELTASPLSAAAQALMLDELCAYDTEAVLAALQRCRRELSGQLTLAAVIGRIDTGMPGADEVFGLLLEAWRNENLTVVVPQAALSAAGMGAWELYLAGDTAGARQAFGSAYERLLPQSDKTWVASVGNDRSHCTQTVMAAVEDGRLSAEAALKYLPADAEDARHRLQTGSAPTEEQRRAGKQQAEQILTLLSHKIVSRE
ncbi:hypothetical protein L1281_000376 [Neisseria sp. HSC-16F19]|nr:hypothetical protein [Neisseria sp. HSC-16F19]MCP2039806.1 hypothetical protein [Neisseria sp. HSC-16F19]